MALNKFQRLIMDTLIEKGDMTVKELATSTGYSASFIRQHVELMVATKDLWVDKRRQPFVYDVSVESPEITVRKTVEAIKNELRTNGESTNPYIKKLRESSKDKWVDGATFFKALAQAIEELEADDELTPTLDS